MDDKAKKRWQILAKVIKSKKAVTETTKRKFQTYNLIQTELVQTSSCCQDSAKTRVPPPSSAGDPASEDSLTCLHTWHRVHCLLLPDLRLQVRLLASSVSLSDLVGFNNTGNVCIWPSEECLAFYCLQNRNRFSGSRVLELGGGMTCLAGLILAAANVAAKVHLTDGNSNAAGNLLDMLEGGKYKDMIEGDKYKDMMEEDKYKDMMEGGKYKDMLEEDKVEEGGDTKVTAAMLRWDDWQALEPLKASFDWVICADCLFFDSGREGLVTAIQHLLTPDGVALIVAPNREGTFTQFENSARRVFDVQVQTNYSPQIWEAHQKWLEDPGYQTDIHYPKLMILSNNSSS